VEQKGLLPAMHLCKKGVQGVHILLTIETISGSPPVASPLLPIHSEYDDDKKTEGDAQGSGRRVWGARQGAHTPPTRPLLGAASARVRDGGWSNRQRA
jgi:hypothetical protein